MCACDVLKYVYRKVCETTKKKKTNDCKNTDKVGLKNSVKLSFLCCNFFISHSLECFFFAGGWGPCTSLPRGSFSLSAHACHTLTHFALSGSHCSRLFFFTCVFHCRRLFLLISCFLIVALVSSISAESVFVRLLDQQPYPRAKSACSQHDDI